MPTIDPNLQPQAVTIWDSQVGRAAAAMPTEPLQQHPLSAALSPISRLALAEALVHQRTRATEKAARTARSNDYLVRE